MALNDGSPASQGLKDNLKTKGRKQRTNQTRAHEAERRTAGAPVRNDLTPKLEFVDRQIDELKAPQREVRKLEPGHITEVAASIGALGFSHPILIAPDGTILDGVIRHAAAKALGIKTVPCVVLNHLTAATQRAARIAFNRLGERGSWNADELRLEIEELIELDAPIEILGFEEAEIDLLLADDEEGDDAVDEAPEVRTGAPPVTQKGDAWSLGDHRVLCGDAREPAAYARLMDSEKARMVMTDVPFNVSIQGHVSGLGAHTHREFVAGSGELTDQEFFEFLEGFILAASAWLMDGRFLWSARQPRPPSGSRRRARRRDR